MTTKHKRINEILGKSFSVAIRLWNDHKISEARALSEHIIHLQLKSFEPMVHDSRKAVMQICTTLARYGNTETLTDIVDSLMQDRNGRSVHEQVEMSCLINRISLLQEKRRPKSLPLAA